MKNTTLPPVRREFEKLCSAFRPSMQHILRDLDSCGYSYVKVPNFEYTNAMEKWCNDCLGIENWIMSRTFLDIETRIYFTSIDDKTIFLLRFGEVCYQ